MYRIKCNLLFFIVVFSCGGLAPDARADSEKVPDEYTQSVADGKYLFVMLAPPRWRNFNSLHKKYPASGLYLNNGSKVPLWRVDWYAFKVQVASDGRHMVRWGDWPRSGDKFETLAVSFYKDGRELKSYRVKDLVAEPKYLPFTVSHYTWCRHQQFDGKRGLLILTTYVGASAAYNLPDDRYSAGTTYVFDLTSGAIIMKRLPPKPGKSAAK